MLNFKFYLKFYTVVEKKSKTIKINVSQCLSLRNVLILKNLCILWESRYLLHIVPSVLYWCPVRYHADVPSVTIISIKPCITHINFLYYFVSLSNLTEISRMFGFSFTLWFTAISKAPFAVTDGTLTWAWCQKFIIKKRYKKQ